jgi:pfkB family carbohydrate kinase
VAHYFNADVRPGLWRVQQSAMPTREEVAIAAADALEAAALPRALIGFDGFIDSIVHMVDRRYDMSHNGYERLRTISAFAQRCAAAAGKSTNIEQVHLQDRFGGNGPLLAGGLARLGVPTTFIGAIADPNAPAAVHPVFREFASWCHKAIAIAPPSQTLCAEFDDGKLMFNETSAVQGVTWQRLLEVVGLNVLRDLVAASPLLGINNWSLLGGVEGIWEGLIRDVLPGLGTQRRVFIDLSDPAKRTDRDIAIALALLTRLAATPGTRLTLGLNFAEAERVAKVCGVRRSTPIIPPPHEELPRLAAQLRESLSLDTVVIHPREGAAAATAQGDAAWFDGPTTLSPQLSTGAGDHFNAGFALAQTLSLPLNQCLALGTATSGVYVRDAQSPTRARLCAFLRELPEPEVG